MYNKEQIIEIINNENFYIDNFIFDAFVKNWKIEEIYEDANGVRYYDNSALSYIREGLNGKTPVVDLPQIALAKKENKKISESKKKAKEDIAYEIDGNEFVFQPNDNESALNLMRKKERKPD